MRKFKTEYTRVEINILRSPSDPDNKKIFIEYFQDGESKGMQGVTLPASICKQSFNDANLTQSIINFFIKD